MGEIQEKHSSKQKHQNDQNNHNQVIGLKTCPNYEDDHEQSHQQSNHRNVREDFSNIRRDGIHANGEMAKDKEKEELLQRENSGEIQSSNDLLSKPEQKQSEMLCHEAKVPSETSEKIQNKSGSEKPRAQKVIEKEGWNSKFSGMLGGQGGLGWVQGMQISN